MMERTTSMKPRKIMLVADPGRETFGALQWVLSHAIVEHDELILLHIETTASWRNAFSTFLRKPSLSSASFGSAYLTAVAALNESNRGGGAAGGGGGGGGAGGGGGGGGGEVDFLEEMKHICEAVQPKVKIQTERVEVEGKDKACTILMQSRVLSVDLLVIGQRRSLSNAILGCKLGGGSTRGGNKGTDTAEYLIENSRCTCVGVQKKGQNGYLLNTKTHKNFWLLA